MKTRVLIYSVLFFLLIPAIHHQRISQAEARSPKFSGWITYWDFDRGIASIAAQPQAWNDIFLFAASFDENASLIVAQKLLQNQPTIAQMASSGIAIWLSVVNDLNVNGNTILKDPAIIHRILTDKKLRDHHIAELIETAHQTGATGVDIDYENLWVKDRETFTDFIKKTGQTLHANGLLFSVTVQPKKGPTQSQGSGAASWKEICPHVDRLQVMLYNLHSKRTGPGAMATLPWIKTVMDYGTTQCSHEKLVPVLKISGMKWKPGNVRDISFHDATRLAEEKSVTVARAPASTGSAPFFSFSSPQGKATVYFEDAKSLRQKIHSLLIQGFTQINFWSLGPHDKRLSRHLAILKSLPPPQGFCTTR